MRKFIAGIIIVVFFALLQSTPFYDGMRSSIGVKADLMLIFLVFMSFRFGSFEGMILGLIGGFLQDMVSIGPLGLNALVYLNIGFFIGLFRKRINEESIVASLFLVLAFTLFKALATFLVNIFFSPLDLSAVALKNQILFEVPINAIIAPVFFLAYDKIFKLIPIKQENV